MNAEQRASVEWAAGFMRDIATPHAQGSPERKAWNGMADAFDAAIKRIERLERGLREVRDHLDDNDDSHAYLAALDALEGRD